MIRYKILTWRIRFHQAMIRYHKKALNRTYGGMVTTTIRNGKLYKVTWK